MLAKITRGLTVQHKVISIITLENKLWTVYDQKNKLDLIGSPLTTLVNLYKIPVETLHDTPELLVLRQVNTSKLGKIRL